MEELAELLGESPVIEALRQRLRQVLARARTRRLPAILIVGETGTGKGLVARLIHRRGPRASGPFVDVNCAAIPDSLLEAELFGFERGAFTDARRAKPGLFQTAHRGTIFLDEVALLPEPMQAKLLKVLEEQAVRRLGSTTSEPVDMSVISATNADLKVAMADRRFRQDLYHRLAVLTLELPPLRERGRDIILLATHFLTRTCTEYGLDPKRLKPDAEARLLLYPWPGNIRELGNVMEKVAVLVEDHAIGADKLELWDTVVQTPVSAATTPALASASDSKRDHLLAALERTNWNISRTASQLRIARNTVRARMARFGLAQDVPARAPAPAAPPSEPQPTMPVPAATPLPIRWERRRLTFLRAALITTEDDQDLLHTARALDTLTEKVRTFGGRVDELEQHGIFAVFGLEPVEDAPRRAAHTAMAIQKAAEWARREHDSFAVKIGIHVGEVLVAQTSAGPEMDAEARRDHWRTLDLMLQLAGAGNTLVTPAAVPFLERRFDLAAESDTSTPAYRLHGRERKGLAPEGRMTHFVGRAAEVELLRSRLAVAKSGSTQIVVITGEAGIGKSRLLHEFRQTLRRESITYLEGHCVSYGSSIPYLPIVAALRRGCRVMDDDTATQVAKKLRATLQHLRMEPDEALPHLMRFMGFTEGTGPLESSTPEVIRARTSQILREMCLSASRQRPLVVVLEDLHWVDPASESLGAMGEISGVVAPLLLILTCRPDYWPSWLHRSRVTNISLPPLSSDESLTLLLDVLPSERVPGPIVQTIVERADGNPFFLEELGRTVMEQGSSSTSGDVPHTVQEVLLARMGRLPERERHVLQSAAAIGRDFAGRLLAAASDLSDSEIVASLDQLRVGEFLHEKLSHPEVYYSFRHALTHEVAYRSLRPEERRKLHARIVEAIAWLYPDRLADLAERLADHALLGEVWDKAVDYLREAGARAFARGAVQEALARYDQALAASDRLPPSPANMRRAIDVRIDLHTPLLVVGQVARLVELHRQAEAVALDLGDPHRLNRLFQRMSQYSWMDAKYDAGIDYAQRALELATSTEDTDGIVLATYSLAQSHYSTGRYGTAIELFGRVVDGPSAERAKRLLAATISTYIAVCGWLGQALSNLGELDRAIAYTDLGVRAADESKHPQAQAIAYTLAAIPRVYRGEVDGAVSLTERALNLCETKGLLTWLPGALSTLGWALTAAGRVEEGLPYLEQGPAVLVTVGIKTHLALMYARWAEGLLLAGRLAEARDIAQRAIDMAAACGERGHEAEGRYFLASVLAAAEPPDFEEATVRFDEARSRAEELGMRPLRARCHLGLGQLLRLHGDEAEGRAQIAAALQLFRETGMRLWLKRTLAALGEVD